MCSVLFCSGVRIALLSLPFLPFWFGLVWSGSLRYGWIGAGGGVAGRREEATRALVFSACGWLGRRIRDGYEICYGDTLGCF